MWRRHSKIIELIKPVHGYACVLASPCYFEKKVLDALSASIYLSKVWIVTLKSERCSRLIKKALARRESIVVIHLFGFIWLHLVWVLLWPFFEKQVNVRCGIGSILMSITSHIHNAAKNAIAKNSCRSNFKKIEVLFSRKQQGAIRTDWKILSCVFYHLCIVVMIFQVATSLSMFSTTRPSLTQCRKQ